MYTATCNTSCNRAIFTPPASLYEVGMYFLVALTAGYVTSRTILPMLPTWFADLVVDCARQMLSGLLQIGK